MKRYTLLLLVITGLTLLSPSLHGEEKSAVNESVKKVLNAEEKPSFSEQGKMNAEEKLDVKEQPGKKKMEEKVTLSVEKRPVTEVLRLIEQQTGYTFSYSPALLNQFPPVTLKVTNQTVTSVLKLIFDDTEVLPVVQEQYIILKKRPKPVTISGFIYDRESHESLIAANVYDQVSGQGTASNNFGFYSLTLPAGEIALRPSYVGYSTEVHAFTAANDTVVHFFLSPSPRLQELVVEGDLNDLLQNVETGKISLNTSTLKSVPSFMSENDVVKVLQQMPGVAVGTDGMAGLYVRGGNADENLYLVDGNPLYHIHHLLGLFSTFNPEAVKTMEFYKGSFPARYGGRLSSVMDVRMNDGDMKKFSGTGSIGLISSRVNLQGPIIKDKTSYSISLRRTYLDLITRPAMHFMNRKSKKEDPAMYQKLGLAYYFYDFNAKVQHKVSDRSRLYLSLYDGKDKLLFDNEQRYGWVLYDNGKPTTFGIDNGIETIRLNVGWGTRMASLTWAYAIHNKLFANATLVYSRYQSGIVLSNEDEACYPLGNSETGEMPNRPTYELYKPTYRSGIRDMGYRVDFDYMLDNNHLIRFGTAFLHHHFRPEESRVFRRVEDGGQSRSDTITGADSRIKVQELSLYAEDDMQLGRRFKANVGVHLSGFFVQGKSYLSAQPRLSARYLWSKEFALKASYSKMNQYVHLLQSSYLNSPDDLWVPITKNVKPLSSDQFSVGAYGKHRGFDLSAEAYYKRSVNQVEYKDGASILAGNAEWEERIAQGIGTSYGLELMAKKSLGNTSGWVGYTLSWANRRFPNGEINRGRTYPAKFDNRHKINAVLTHTFNQKFDLSLSWVYATGNWTTLPLEEYTDMDGNKRHYFHQRNNYKMPNYQRLDLSFNYYRHKKNGRTAIWNFSVYNLYAHHNSFMILPGEKSIPNPATEDGQPRKSYPVYQSFALLPIVPSFSYTIKF